MNNRINQASWLLLAWLLALGGCVSMTPEEQASAVKNAMAARPVANWLHIPENQPFVGDRAVFETSDGPLRYEVSVAGRKGDTYQVRISWLSTPPAQSYLLDLSYLYEVSLRSDVLAARLDDSRARTSKPLKVAGPGDLSYVSQPTILKLPVAEFIDTGKRKVRADAVLVNESRQGGTAMTQIFFLSDEVRLGVAQVITVASASLGISDVVGLVAAARMNVRQPGQAAASLLDTLGPRLTVARHRSVSKLVEP